MIGQVARSTQSPWRARTGKLRRVAASSPQGRFVDGASSVNGRVLKKATAWGKHLFHHYEGGRVVHVHLGLYGTFTEVPIPMPLPVGQVRAGLRVAND